ncbi:hypothetical protein BCR32DRAFT_276515 [Anaeromyces robustus]|uniref:Uncharacterized protein n=1 Tax=Anaeromyces robustus TaxID=1754192 RepID=A0A1Y1XH64_9FUNG|nr:hypothetical protein BCR32DRAFT_276515 [Anaeromyces robustus]|eukprot:ORX85101.1 hypothetical protein BCR32DRAFT_276515 [Anaeromyces robustus]
MNEIHRNSSKVEHETDINEEDSFKCGNENILVKYLIGYGANILKKELSSCEHGDETSLFYVIHINKKESSKGNYDGVKHHYLFHIKNGSKNVIKNIN